MTFFSRDPIRIKTFNGVSGGLILLLHNFVTETNASEMNTCSCVFRRVFFILRPTESNVFKINTITEFLEDPIEINTSLCFPSGKFILYYASLRSQA